MAMAKALRILVCAGAMLILTAAGASAQGVGISPDGQMSFSPFKQQEKRPLTQDEVDRQRKLDDAYKAATNKIPEQKSTDPWGNVRTSAPAPAAKKKTTTQPQ
jgi:C-terminal processing protease CtpA/Prc